MAADIADEDPGIRRCLRQRAAQCLEKIVDAREILDHGVQDDDIEGADDAGDIGGGPFEQGHVEVALGRLREFAADISSATGEKSVATYSAHCPARRSRSMPVPQPISSTRRGTQGGDAANGLLHPFAHFRGRERLAAVGAVPAHSIEIAAAAALVGVVPHRAPARGKLAGLIAIRRRHRFRPGDDIGDQARVAAALHDRRGSRVDPLMLLERRLDLAELDAIAAYLDLVIEPAEIFDLPVRAIANLVAGAGRATCRRRTGWARSSRPSSRGAQ